MCAEADWSRCHRSLIADYLKVRGYEVVHIRDAEKSESHPFTKAARLVNGNLSYAARNAGTNFEDRLSVFSAESP